MAAPAEAQIEISETQSIPEQYAHSLSTIRHLGSVAVGLPESTGVRELAYDDFITGVAEMFKTDIEHGEDLEVNNERIHEIVNGRVCAKDGIPMVDKLKNGRDKTKELANFDDAWQAQAERDGYDVEIAEQVDKLKPGQTLWGISYKPEAAMKKYPDLYKELGYGDLVYIQTYSKVDEYTLVAGSYSIAVDSKTSLQEMVAAFGMEVPEDASDSEWLHFAQSIIASPETTREMVFKFRSAYYESVGRNINFLSATEIVERHKVVTRSIFETYYPRIGNALATGENDPILQDFAIKLLSQGIDLKADYRRELEAVASRDTFDDESARILDLVIRYATVEEIRKSISSISGHSITTEHMGNYKQNSVQFNPAEVSGLLASNVRVGVESGRSYGGCPGNIKLGNEQSRDITSPQEAYGGLESENDSAPEKDELPKFINCIKCKKRVASKDVVKPDSWCCPKCGHKVDVCNGKVIKEGKIDNAA